MNNTLKTVSYIFSLLIFTLPALAQEEVQRNAPMPVECGTIVPREFFHNAEEQAFAINVDAGTILDVSVVPLGQLNTFIIITGPTNLGVAVSNAQMTPNEVRVVTLEPQPRITTSKLGSTGTYTIRVVNTKFVHARAYVFAEDRYDMGYHPGGIGAYSLYIGCTLPDGRIIKPGNPTPPVLPSDDVEPPAFGFPGLDPVDFAGAEPLPLEIGSGRINSNSNEVEAFYFEADAGDILQLDLQRRAGNLNLGLVVLSAENQVVSYGGLITGDTFSTRITLPSTGQYTIGVFRVELLPPADPQATAFQITGTLNP
jgi:hypothetical protein